MKLTPERGPCILAIKHGAAIFDTPHSLIVK